MAKKTKTLFALLLVLVMVFTAACSSKDADDKDDKKSDKGSTSLSGVFGKDDEDEKDSEAETTAPFDINELETTDPIAEEETEPTEPSQDDEQPENSGNIVGTVLYDKDGIKVTVTGFEAESYFGPEIYVLVENNSDKDAIVTTDLLSVNGYMMNDVGLYAEVAAGTETDDFFMFDYDEMARCGIKELSRVEFCIKVIDPESYDTIDISKLQTLNLTPACNQTIDYSGIELYNDGSIRIIYKDMESDSMFDALVYFFVENNTGKDVAVYADSITINGVACDEAFWADMRKGTVVLDAMVIWDLSAANLESIDQIETMELKFRVIDYESWDELTVTDTVTINIEK